MTPIYLDYQATTPLAPEVAAAMRPWAEDKFANPHSAHRLGREAAAAVEVARGQVLGALYCCHPGEGRDPGSPRQEGLGPGLRRGDENEKRGDENEKRGDDKNERGDGKVERGDAGGSLHFTSGATEALNWALKGALTRLPPERRLIVTLATEHAAVLDTVEWLGRMGAEVEVLPVGQDGRVDLNHAAERITPATGLVAAMLVNNEIGVVQPIAELAAIARAQGALFLCDAVQGFGRVPLPLDACDMVALSAHKVHGPKGIGALWVREGVELDPLLHGGGQEGGVRSGTLSPALCAGFGAAAQLLVKGADEDYDHIARLAELARGMVQDWILNGSETHRYSGNLNIRRPGVDAARLIADVRQVAFSAGSACASGSARPSHVLRAIGLTQAEARSSIRLGFGRYTTEDEVAEALTLINAAAHRQRRVAA